MPLVQFDLPRPLFEEKGTEISEEVHFAFIDALDIPPDDKFQVFVLATMASWCSTRRTEASTAKV